MVNTYLNRTETSTQNPSESRSKNHKRIQKEINKKQILEKKK